MIAGEKKIICPHCRKRFPCKNNIKKSTRFCCINSDKDTDKGCHVSEHLYGTCPHCGKRIYFDTETTMSDLLSSGVLIVPLSSAAVARIYQKGDDEKAAKK